MDVVPLEPRFGQHLNSLQGGWFSPDALNALASAANASCTADDHIAFDDLYVTDPKAFNRGFDSWDAFFTREFRSDVRPVAAPDDPSVIVSPCETETTFVLRNAVMKDDFSLKGHTYSLEDMLDNLDFAVDFEAGTVYQAWLDPLAYHRWHAPVDATVVGVHIVPGAYFAQSPSWGFDGNEDGAPDSTAPRRSQAFVAHVASRAIITLDAGEDIGRVIFMPVGLAERSSIEVMAKEGDKVAKGDQLGMFHFGGSTHCLIFQPHVKLDFMKPPDEPFNELNSPLAYVTK